MEAAAERQARNNSSHGGTCREMQQQQHMTRGMGDGVIRDEECGYRRMEVNVV